GLVHGPHGEADRIAPARGGEGSGAVEILADADDRRLLLALARRGGEQGRQDQAAAKRHHAASRREFLESNPGGPEGIGLGRTPRPCATVERPRTSAQEWLHRGPRVKVARFPGGTLCNSERSSSPTGARSLCASLAPAGRWAF